MSISVKREHDFVEKITDMKGPKYIVRRKAAPKNFAH